MARRNRQKLSSLGPTFAFDDPSPTGSWPHDGGKAVVGNGSHFGFLAVSKAQVDAFYAKALELGAVSEGAPGPRPLYGPQYYGCFVRDLDGHKIEAQFSAISAG